MAEIENIARPRCFAGEKIANSRRKVLTFCNFGIMNIPEDAGGK